MKRRTLFISLLVACFALACSDATDDSQDPVDDGPSTVSVSYDFESGSQGWQGGAGDYPNGAQDQVAFMSEVRPVPDVEDGGSGLYVQADNINQDVFIYLKRKLDADDGVEPDTSYKVDYSITFASNYPNDCPTTPGSKVQLKAGLSTFEPASILSSDQQTYDMNVRVGEGAVGGEEASSVSNIMHEAPCDEVGTSAFVSVTRSHVHPTAVETAPDGTIWLLIGLDSRLQGTNELYFLDIDATLEPVTEE